MQDKKSTDNNNIMIYIPVPIMTLSNSFYEGGRNTSLLTYFQPISSKLSSLLLGNLSNLSISLLIKNLNKNAIKIVSSNNIIVFKLNDFHYNSSLSNFL